MPRGIPKNKASQHQLAVYGGGKRNYLDRDKDRWFIVAEVAKGRTYQDIADELNEMNEGYSLTSMSIHNEVEAALVEWKRENYENIDAYIAKDLARLEHIEKIVMEDYQNSKNPSPHDYAALMKRGMSIEEIDEMFEQRKMGGDPRYIQVLLNLQHQRMKLLGLDKGQDVAKVSVVNYNFGDIDIEDINKIADKLQESKYNSLIDEQ